MMAGGDQVFIGWDVGGWNCDKNPNSRYALVVLDTAGAIIGQPWRGSLRQTINAATYAADFLTAILTLCKLPANPARVTLAIDAPLGFPAAFAALITGGLAQLDIGRSATNPYLYRLTERRLVDEGITALSAVKDMIGSQSAKAMHAVARFTTPITSGVWSDGAGLTIIETYPALCRKRSSGSFNDLASATTSREGDILDAGVCAHIAHAYALRRDWLEGPTPDAPVSEGWIWAPLPQDLSKEVEP
tara:strand:+ start:5752 stop:6489 length:738 start_codon:yes stop_codon:yes gene_type:complete